MIILLYREKNKFSRARVRFQSTKFCSPVFLSKTSNTNYRKFYRKQFIDRINLWKINGNLR